MKRVIYIGIAAIALVFTSCQKEVIAPNSSSDVFDISSMRYENGSIEEGGKVTSDGSGDGSGIVDPNGEEDGSDKPIQQSGN